MDLSVLPTAGELMPLGARAPRWRAGLPCAACSEVFASGDEASGAALALALALDGLGEERAGRSFLWVQDKAALRLNGRPYRPGLPAAVRHRVIHVGATTPEDALFALEEGLRCRELACVVGEIAGNPKALDFTASRRLTLTAEKHGVPLFLVRLDAKPDLSSARMRWQARAAPSLSPRWNAEAPGSPSWRAELFRARGHAPGEWILDDGTKLSVRPSKAARDAPRNSPKAHHGDLAGAAGGRPLAAR
jgi:protein ImuA